MKFKEILIKNKEIAQLVYGVLLIIIIPLLVVFNTIFIINGYNRAIDIGLQRQALSLGRILTPFFTENIDNQNYLNRQLAIIKNNNPDILEIGLLKKNKNGFVYMASSEPELKDQEVFFYYYDLAWTQPANDALVTDSLSLARKKNNKVSANNLKDKKRFWLLAKPLINSKGERLALLTLRISSEVVDDLTRYHRNISIIVLIITVLIIVLFLGAAIRLWDYVLLYNKIKEVDKMKDEFISMVSHELRTPVTGIKGYSSMILDGTFGQTNSEIKRSAKIIYSSAQRLSILIEDLLNVSRIEQGRLKVSFKRTDVFSVLKSVINELEGQAKEKGIKLRLDFAEKKPLFIETDAKRLAQILVNIVGNAIKYTPKGEVMVKLLNKKENIKFIVKDTGIGISEEDKKHLFEKFYRVRNEKTKNINGTGLGMWITKKIVELMNGSISIESIENVGTQVVLIFPKEKK